MRLIEREFIAKYKNFALETERKTGISHLFTLGQASLESGWGLHAPNYNPQNEMYQKLKRNVHFLSGG